MNTTKIALEASLKELLKKKPFDKITIADLTEDCEIFEAVLENKPFIMNVYHSVNREKIESFLYKLTYQLIADVVEEKCSRDHLPETDKQFIADFYKYGFVGIMLDWIDRGMKEDYQKIVDLLAVTLHGNIANSIRNFEQVKEKNLICDKEDFEQLKEYYGAFRRHP